MEITREQLEQIIKEEIEEILRGPSTNPGPTSFSATRIRDCAERWEDLMSRRPAPGGDTPRFRAAATKLEAECGPAEKSAHSLKWGHTPDTRTPAQQVAAARHVPISSRPQVAAWQESKMNITKEEQNILENLSGKASKILAKAKKSIDSRPREHIGGTIKALTRGTEPSNILQFVNTVLTNWNGKKYGEFGWNYKKSLELDTLAHDLGITVDDIKTLSQVGGDLGQYKTRRSQEDRYGMGGKEWETPGAEPGERRRQIQAKGGIVPESNMKLTKSQLQQIIKEETLKVYQEGILDRLKGALGSEPVGHGGWTKGERKAVTALLLKAFEKYSADDSPQRSADLAKAVGNALHSLHTRDLLDPLKLRDVLNAIAKKDNVLKTSGEETAAAVDAHVRSGTPLPPELDFRQTRKDNNEEK